MPKLAPGQTTRPKATDKRQLYPTYNPKPTGSEAVALLEQLVENDDDNASDEKLKDDQNGVSCTQLTHITVHAGNNVGNSLSNSDENTEKLLCSAEECAVLFQALQESGLRWGWVEDAVLEWEHYLTRGMETTGATKGHPRARLSTRNR